MAPQYSACRSAIRSLPSMMTAPVALGWINFMKPPITRMPNGCKPLVTVVVSQFGASPGELETQVTKRSRTRSRASLAINHIRSARTDGVLYHHHHLPTGNGHRSRVNDVKDAVTRVRAELPRGIDEPLVRRVDLSGLPILTYAAIAPGMTPSSSFFVEDVVSRELQGIRGVGQRRADRQRSARDPRRARSDPAAVGRIDGARCKPQLRSSNVDLAGGRAEVGGRDQAIRTLAGAKTLSDLGATTIALPTGGEVRLDNLGLITDTITEQRTARFNGTPVVGVSIVRAKGASDVVVAEAVAARIDAIKAKHPEVELKLIDLSVEFTLGNYDAAMHTLYEGAILAVIVVFMFLRDWRATIIAAITLPLSILPAFWVMNVLGFSLNIVSLLAITLSVGILVDDAIVEIENIVRHIQMGKSPYRAALGGSRRDRSGGHRNQLDDRGGVSAGGLSVLWPGQFFKQFGLTVSVQVLFSLLSRGSSPLCSRPTS